MILQELENKGLVHPPSWLSSNVQYLSIMGSVAYGVSSDTSDMDLYGFVIPKKGIVFPHLAGIVQGFGYQGEKFDQWQQHGIESKDALAGKGRTYDFTIFNIIRYFELLMANNPNILDSVWTPQECVLHITQVGTMVRESRKLFLHKGCFQKFKGYAFSQIHKMTSKKPIGKRKKIREEFGFDAKFAYHLVRLLEECQQLLMCGDMDLQQNREHLKAIRRGEVSQEDILKWASDKERQLEKLYTETKLPDKPDENKLKQLLLNCLEHHYGSLDKCIEVPDKYKQVLQEVKSLIYKAGV